MLSHIIYISQAVKPMTDRDLEQLLVSARENNKKEQITGQLLYKDQYFIQLLEGEEETIQRMFKKISKDSRHKNVKKISNMDVVLRSHDNWSMGFSNLDDSDDKMLEGFAPHKLNDSNLVYRLLRHFTQ